jgi:hypothetical protein
MTEEDLTTNEMHREFAKRTNGRVWKLLEKEERTQLENDELLYAAYASCYHWFKVGTGVHQQRGEYLIAKVCISLGIPEQALHHAKRCLELTKQHQGEMADFDKAFAYECLARAYAMCGAKDEGLKYYQLAKEEGAKIQAPTDKEIFDSDLESGNWFGLV